MLVVLGGKTGVTNVEAIPLSSLTTAHEDWLAQAASVAPFVAAQPTVAPLTAVTPSAATTFTITGFVAVVPAGVGGFIPCTSTSLSVAAAPSVSTFVIVENAPVTGSLTVNVCGPSLCAGRTASI